MACVNLRARNRYASCCVMTGRQSESYLIGCLPTSDTDRVAMELLILYYYDELIKLKAFTKIIPNAPLHY